ncbi:MAG TPA: GYD domain-containing protein [Dehalococcoidia bacterium]|nr:GYD domain-containing protein [Dehalococcoidia bacterium]
MSKYLVHATYTPEGVKGLLKEGGTGRRKAVEDALRSVGGKLDAIYFAFGDTDAYLICDVPDAESAIAVSLVAGATGTVRVKTTVLITPEQMDAAAKKTVSFRPAGG